MADEFNYNDCEDFNFYEPYELIEFTDIKDGRCPICGGKLEIGEPIYGKDCPDEDYRELLGYVCCCPKCERDFNIKERNL